MDMARTMLLYIKDSSRGDIIRTENINPKTCKQPNCVKHLEFKHKPHTHSTQATSVQTQAQNVFTPKSFTYPAVKGKPTPIDSVAVRDGDDFYIGAVGGDDDAEGDKEKEEEAERERQEAIKEAEDRRKEKHRKMEEEREKMRQEIRDKYNIKKKEEIPEPEQEEPANPLMRKKKTPEELAREAEEAEQDDFTKLKNTIENQVTEIKTQIESKCSLQ